MKSEGNKLHGFEPRVLVETVDAAAVDAEDILAALAGVTKRLLPEAQGSSSSSSSSSPLSLVEAVADKDSLAGVRRRFLVLGQGAIFSLPVNEESSRARLVPTSGSSVVGAEETMAKQLVLNKKIIAKKNY